MLLHPVKVRVENTLREKRSKQQSIIAEETLHLQSRKNTFMIVAGDRTVKGLHAENP